MFYECLEVRRKTSHLISPSKIISFEKYYQAFDTVFHQQMKHLEVRQKFSAVRRIFISLLSVSCNISNMRCSVSSPDETPRRELKIRRAAEYF